MAVIELREVRGDEGDYRNGRDADHVRRWIARSDDATDRSPDIVSYALLPKQGQRDPFDPLAVVKRIRATRRRDSNWLWDVVAESSRDYVEDDGLSPLEKPAEFDWNAEQFLNSTKFDIKGRPILTTARSLIPVPFEDSRWVINVEKNVAAVPRQLLKMNNRINSGTVTVDGVPFQKHKLMCKGLRIPKRKRERHNGRLIVYRPLTFQLHYRPEGWKVAVPNVDFVELVKGFVPKRSANGREIETDENGEPIMVPGRVRQRIETSPGSGEFVTEPVPIDRQGRAIDLDSPDFSPSQIIKLKKDVYFPANFGNLPLR